ncbi:hypothetical protein VC253_07965, partial [Xanthomonas campestris]|uniref:hypothetical protein n=1 Tax=Xanthomonas campestris TaxID=339 RepID=UPI002B231F03
MLRVVAVVKVIVQADGATQHHTCSAITCRHDPSTGMQALKPPRRYFQVYAGILELRMAWCWLLLPCIAVPVSNGISACRGFTPVFTDTYKKADQGHEECSCQSAG